MNEFESLKKWKNPNGGVVVLYPGGFKPLSGGHISLIRRYAKIPEVKEVRLLVGPGVRNGIGQDTAVAIAEKFLKDDPKITVEPSKWSSPVLTAYKEVEDAAPGQYTLASSSKGNDWERTKSFIEQHQPGGKYHEKLADGVEIVALPVNVEPANYSGRNDEFEGQPISASNLRKDIMNDDRVNFDTNYPGEDQEAIDFVWYTLNGTLSESLNQY
ncbi:MAG: hypothetical protein HC831_20620 [Chloroflexia bacterium]|nr:hypothetical protein [Chloroflexia bacterium]